MAIDEKTLLEQREVLEKDFNALNDRIKQVEKDLVTMKSNLNAVYGAVQQVDKLLEILKPADKKKMPVDKEQALNIATS